MRALLRALEAWAAVLVVLSAAAPAMGGHPFAAVTLTIDPESAQQLMERGITVLPVDLRSTDEYRGGRLPRARSLPLATLRQSYADLPRSGVIVLYGPAGADEATAAYQFLRAQAYANVFVLEGGFAAWRQRGYGVER